MQVCLKVKGRGHSVEGEVECRGSSKCQGSTKIVEGR